MVLAYIFFCLGMAAPPWKFFQLNARYFDRRAGIFSKARMDEMIPREWRLAQWPAAQARAPRRYPVFIKPEWSQNARGVRRADDAAQLQNICAQLATRGGDAQFLIQECAPEKMEYEIFSVRARGEECALLTLTQVSNERDAHPVNSVYNPATRYTDITASLDESQRAQLWKFVRRIGDFPISRVSVRADSRAALLRGAFHVIEINLFLPMPINLLDRAHSRMHVLRFALRCMWHLARATKHRARAPSAAVFTKSMLYNRRGKLWRALRARI